MAVSPSIDVLIRSDLACQGKPGRCYRHFVHGHILQRKNVSVVLDILEAPWGQL